MFQRWLQQLRFRLASPDAALPYALLGIIAGSVAAIVIIGFRELLFLPLGQWLPRANTENFEALPRYLHFLLPVAGSVVLGVFLHFCDRSYRHVGISHVIASLHQGTGKLPWQNALVQFTGSLLALATGQSGGREGPAVHMGAAASSAVGQSLSLPHNSLRVLAACGTAAAIAASFNTPIAGVVFAMEVIMLEYTVAGFVPVILAAVTATAFNQFWHGSEAFLPVTPVEMRSLMELPFIAFLGFAAGLLSSTFVVIQKACLRQVQRPVLLRMLFAGVVTGLCALLAPEILGTGYDSVKDTLDNALSVQLLLILVVTKLLASAVTCGMGVPVGVIGPSMVVGAFAGAAIGFGGTALLPSLASDPNFYMMLGMGAMMGALLNAPLAALLAVVELTHNLELIFPAMLAITVAHLTHRTLFGLQSSQRTTLTALQHSLRTDPVTMALLRTSVMAVMERDITLTEARIDREQARELLERPSEWLLVKNPEGKYIAIARENWVDSLGTALKQSSDEDTMDLLDILEKKLRTAPIDIGSTLREALDTMNKQGLDVLFVRGSPASLTGPAIGIITRNRIEQYYKAPIAF